MSRNFKPERIPLKAENDLVSLVENRSVYGFTHGELTIFETRQKSENVRLRLSGMTLTSMVRGKKVMRILNARPFDYIPGESVIVPEREEMVIDFPEADDHHPTQCIALSFDNDLLKETLHLLNERYPKAEQNDHWKINLDCFHFQNSYEIAATIDRLVKISNENIPGKDLLVDLTLKELLVRLMQTQARQLILENFQKSVNTHRFAFVVDFIKSHLHEEITIDKLSSMSCMSKPTFFRSFKREFGMSPLEFVIRQRIREAKRLLKDLNMTVSEACYAVGMNNQSHFFKLFKRVEGVTPNEFRKQALRR